MNQQDTELLQRLASANQNLGRLVLEMLGPQSNDGSSAHTLRTLAAIFQQIVDDMLALADERATLGGVHPHIGPATAADAVDAPSLGGRVIENGAAGDQAKPGWYNAMLDENVHLLREQRGLTLTGWCGQHLRLSVPGGSSTARRYCPECLATSGALNVPTTLIMPPKPMDGGLAVLATLVDHSATSTPTADSEPSLARLLAHADSCVRHVLAAEQAGNADPAWVRMARAAALGTRHAVTMALTGPAHESE